MSVSMKDVARQAGVSIATVSKCLHGKRGIPARTREAVIKVAEAMGYRPNPLVSALMQTRRTRSPASRDRPTLAFVTAFPTPDGWLKMSSPLQRLLFKGAEERAEERGYQISPYWLYRDEMSNQRFGEMLRARGVQGLLLAPLPRLGMRIELPWQHFSVVAHGLTLAEPVFHRTSNDHYQSMVLAMRECWRSGYRRPGFLMDGPLSKRLERRWEAAYMIMRESLGFDTRVASLLYQAWDPDEVCRWVRRERPDVVIALIQDDHLRQLAERGLRIPEELGVVSLSVHEPGSRLTGIHQNARHIGHVAIDKLIALVERNETGIPSDPVTLTIEGRWNAGHTLLHRMDNDHAQHQVI